MINLTKVFMLILSNNGTHLETKYLDGGWETIEECRVLEEAINNNTRSNWHVKATCYEK